MKTLDKIISESNKKAWELLKNSIDDSLKSGMIISNIDINGSSLNFKEEADLTININLTKDNKSNYYTTRRTVTGRIVQDRPNMQDLPREKRRIHLWTEGFSATGHEPCASYHGPFYARDLKEAVKMFKDTLPEEDKNLVDVENLTFWGCGFFDNEADARRSFG